MRSTLTRVAVTLIAINAALAILILLSGEMGDTEGRILGTSLLATGTALLVMMQLPALSDGRLGPVPLIGIGAAAVGFALVTAGIWTEVEADSAWRVAATGYVLAGAAAVAALLAGLPIAGRAAWVGTSTLWAVAVAAAMIVFAIWAEIDIEGYWRLFGAVAVLVAAGGLAVPILHRSSRPAPPRDTAIMYCPFCATDLGLMRATDVTCPSCGNRFTVTLHAEEGVRKGSPAG